MDRTIIGPWRAEERELSEKLYKKLQGLALLYPPSDEFRKCLSEEMFLKPNQQAFFHVTHFLFRLLDPAEFRKRFYWPITDKRSEANFRSSTVEYLKYLNEKHQLQWTNIKSYLVVMPGGMKFINFMLDLVGFVIKELTRQREKQLSLDVDIAEQVSELNLKRMRRQNEFFKEYASAYLGEVEAQNCKLHEQINRMHEHMSILAHRVGIDKSLLTDEMFLSEFEESNRSLFRQEFVERSADVANVERPVLELKDAMDRFYAKEASYKYDKQMICQQLRCIHQHFPTELDDGSFSSKIKDDDVNIDVLIATFNGIYETVRTELSAANKKRCAGEFVAGELTTLQEDLHHLETQMSNFQKLLNTNAKKRKCVPHTPMRTACGLSIRSGESSLISKFISTPPIKLEMVDGSRNANLRLPLFDTQPNSNMDTFNNLLSVPRSAHKLRPASARDQSLHDLNATFNRSKIIDPLHLLRTINKDTSKYKVTPNISISHSTLGAKWKQRQSLFAGDAKEFALVDDLSESTDKGRKKTILQSLSLSTSILQSPHTPFNSNDQTRIARPQQHLPDASITAPPSDSTLPYLKKALAVKKVQDASLNFANLSTSPSGRLDPLVPMEMVAVPKLKLNDVSLYDEQSNLNNTIGAEAVQPYFNTSLNDILDGHQTDIENNPNASNIQPIENDVVATEDDLLFNISDSVLKDVIM